LLAHPATTLVPSASSVVLAPVAALFRNERGGDDLAVDLELEEPPRDPEPARAGLVADAQLASLRPLALELAQELFQRMQVVADRAQGTDLAVPAPLGDGDGDRFFVDIEPHEEDRFTYAFVG
jgi:hypothetical protein